MGCLTNTHAGVERRWKKNRASDNAGGESFLSRLLFKLRVTTVSRKVETKLPMGDNNTFGGREHRLLKRLSWRGLYGVETIGDGDDCEGWG